MRQILVHCGLHKTATTTIQIALAEQFDRLRSLGFLYPLAGRIDELSGHHNIAWQIARDRRFNRENGDLDALFKEIQAFDGHVLVSTEDFENSVSRIKRFLPLLQRARSIGRSVTFIVYIRSQVSYLESLYQEMLKYGFGDEYAEFADAALAHGSLRLKEWQFQFNYWNLATSLMQLPDCKIVFRSYERMLEESPILDFYNTAGIPLSALPPSLHSRANVRYPSKVSLTQFYGNRVERDLDSHETAVIDQLFGLFTEPIATTAALRRELEQRFAYSNKRVCDYFGIPSAGLVPEGDVSASAPIRISMQKMFSFETQNAIRDIALMRARNQADAARALAQQCVDAWRDSGR
ncbi:hypothetical protein FVF58_37180 [Paraburkholderia panacisoli]|uniref:Sulfotransferase family protein n=1 Tax=Paraburkholderia panacisoli TaxID=2603818 RepID=A0A5B0GIQ0_9BURK|nr:hypothetical protein [Paraburkholderia panacisoli]KAA1002561.1 hypothetical protein FVF58_37180 [Paraburkholderia panacisoli]